MNWCIPELKPGNDPTSRCCLLIMFVTALVTHVKKNKFSRKASEDQKLLPKVENMTHTRVLMTDFILRESTFLNSHGCVIMLKTVFLIRKCGYCFLTVNESTEETMRLISY